MIRPLSESALTRPVSMFIIVVLPAPLGPSNPKQVALFT